MREAAQRIAAVPQRFGKPVIVVGNLRQAQEAVAEPFRQAGIPSYAMPCMPWCAMQKCADDSPRRV